MYTAPILLPQYQLSSRSTHCLLQNPLAHNVDTWWSLNFCRRRRTWTCGKRAPFYRWGSINLILFLPHPHFQLQVPSDKVQIRTNSEGVQMVYGTCPILVEGNEYIFRLEMFYCAQVAHSSLNESDHNDLSSRIKAVNKSSKGHWNYSIPSEPSDSMIAKIRYSEKSSTTCFMLPPMITIASFISEQ